MILLRALTAVRFSDATSSKTKVESRMSCFVFGEEEKRRCAVWKACKSRDFGIAMFVPEVSNVGEVSGWVGWNSMCSLVPGLELKKAVSWVYAGVGVGFAIVVGGASGVGYSVVAVPD